jgi:hypothetical protein
MDLEAARLLLLSGQGLLDDPERPATVARLESLIEKLGYVQVDSIATVARAHDLTLFARMSGYRPRLLANAVERRRTLFENWTHDAAVIPIKWYAHWKHRFARAAERIHESGWWRERFGEEPQRTLAEVEARIRDEGPLLARNFEGERRGEAGWWGWKPQKAALELLWRSGTLCIARRVNFQKVYDLAERVLPEAHGAPVPAWSEHVAWACSAALERLGFASPRQIAAYWAAVSLPEARAWCHEAERRGEIVAVAKGVYAWADWRHRLGRLPSPPAGLRLLAPFDPILRDRRRALELFDFDYRFEAFTPAAQRVYGYYVLPILEGDRLVGRIEPKLHKREGRLEVRGLWWEKKVRATRLRRSRLDEALERLAAFLGAGTITLHRRD